VEIIYALVCRITFAYNVISFISRGKLSLYVIQDCEDAPIEQLSPSELLLTNEHVDNDLGYS